MKMRTSDLVFVHICDMRPSKLADLAKMTNAECQTCVTHISKSVRPTVMKFYMNINQYMRIRNLVFICLCVRLSKTVVLVKMREHVIAHTKRMSHISLKVLDPQS